MTLPKLLHTFEATLLSLISMKNEPGECLEAYLDTSKEGSYKNVVLTNHNPHVLDIFNR